MPVNVILKKGVPGLKTPKLFETPLYDYADEVNRKRNKSWYTKIKRLEQESKELRLRLEYYIEKKRLMVAKTKQLMALSAEIHNKYLVKKYPSA